MNRLHTLKTRLLPAFVLTLFLSAVLAAGVWGAEEDYYGNYTGSFTGTDEGYWVATINADPLKSVFLLRSTDTGDGDGGYLLPGSEAGTVMHFTSSTILTGSDVTADVDSGDGNVTGTWENSDSGDSGTIAGQQTVSCAYAGTYAGTITGGMTATFTMTIAADGYVTTTVKYGSQTFHCYGGAHPDGHVLGTGKDHEKVDFFSAGEISGSNISGVWVSANDVDGAFTGTKVSDSSGGGGGGGGCFIQSLLP